MRRRFNKEDKEDKEEEEEKDIISVKQSQEAGGGTKWKAICAMLDLLKHKTSGPTSSIVNYDPNAIRSKITKMGCTFKLVRLLASLDFPPLQLLVVQILPILAGGTEHHVRSILEADALPDLISLGSSLSSESDQAHDTLGRATASLIEILRQKQLALDAPVMALESVAKADEGRGVFFELRRSPCRSHGTCVFPAI